jgi:hypothetical protein
MHWVTGVIGFAAGWAVAMVLREGLLASGPAERTVAGFFGRRRRGGRPLWWYD